MMEPPALHRLYALARNAASGSLDVLIVGETGVGKTALARWFHEHSRHALGPIVSLTCEGRSHELEKAMFGRARRVDREAFPGIFEAGNGGTVILEDIASLPLPNQAMLLRAVERRRATRQGDAEDRLVDVRIVSTTHENLWELVRRRDFRMDLMYRLGVIRLAIPSLRQRPEDVEPLARHFLVELAPPGRNVELSREVLDLFRSFAWPRNLTQLRAVIDQAIARCAGSTILPAHIDVETLRKDQAPEQSLADEIERREREQIIAEVLHTGSRASTRRE